MPGPMKNVESPSAKERMTSSVDFAYRLSRLRMYWLMAASAALFVLAGLVLFRPRAVQGIPSGWLALLFVLVAAVLLLASTKLTRLRDYGQAVGSSASSRKQANSSTLRQLFAFPAGDDLLPHLGYRIFKWLLVLAFVLLLALIAYAGITYPTPADAVQVTAGTTAGERIEALRELRNGWLQQVKDLGQMFILTPLFPLIGAVVGYLFGVRKAEAGDKTAPEEVPDASSAAEAESESAPSA
jgi:hypothetical protein